MTHDPNINETSRKPSLRKLNVLINYQLDVLLTVKKILIYIEEYVWNSRSYYIKFYRKERNHS